MTRQERERRAAAPKGSSITRRATIIMVSGKQIIIQILWLTPIHRVMVSVIKENRPQEGQSLVLIRSA